MGMELNSDLGRKNLAGFLDGFINRLRSRRPGSILERQRIERNTVLEDLFESVDVECGAVRITVVKSRRKSHQSNSDLMFESGIGNAAAGVGKIADVIQGVEVADRGDAVFLEKDGMQVDDVTGLGAEPDHVHTTGESLEIDVAADHFAAFVHHIECIFLAVEIERLETGAAADLEIGGSGFFCRLEGGKEILCFHACAETGLESVTERAIHVIDLFHTLAFFL